MSPGEAADLRLVVASGTGAILWRKTLTRRKDKGKGDIERNRDNETAGEAAVA